MGPGEVPEAAASDSRTRRRRASGRARLALVALGLAALLALGACGGPGQGMNDAAAGTTRGDAKVTLVSISPSPPTLGPSQITVTLTTAAGEPISGAKLQVQGDMAMAGMRPVVGVMTDEGNGRYLSHGFSFSMGGNWIVTVSGALPDGKTVEQRIPVPSVGGWSDPG